MRISDWSSDVCSSDLPDLKIKGEMLDLAKHIIDTKAGEFDPRSFDDRYDQALAELVKAKIEGREIKVPERPKETKVVDLMEALRRSAQDRSEEHTSELQSLMRISYAVFCLKTKKTKR